MKLWREPFDHKAKATTPGHVRLDKEKCKGCGYCVEFCPQKVLVASSDLSPKGYSLPKVEDNGKCLSCGFCEAICPEFALTLSADHEPIPDNKSVK
jgi:2-oxoglutarate ferredoxin oxidoreductase subunit delta